MAAQIYDIAWRSAGGGHYNRSGIGPTVLSDVRAEITKVDIVEIFSFVLKYNSKLSAWGQRSPMALF
jgi:hypothetical protein